MNPYVIMTDTTTDLPEDYIREHGLSILSLNYILDGQTYDREHPLDVKEFYEKMRAGSMPTTSQVNPEQAKTAMCACLETGQDVLYIAFSSGLSGTYNSGRIAAEEIAEEGLFPERKVVVADWVERNKLHICHNFTVDDLFHLHRGGRVSKATAILGTMMNVKPVLHVDDEGHLIAVGKVRGRKKSISALVDRMAEQMNGFAAENDVVFISHGDCIEDVEYLERLIREKFGITEFLVNEVGPTIGAHSGPGTLAVFFVGEPR